LNLLLEIYGQQELSKFVGKPIGLEIKIIDYILFLEKGWESNLSPYIFVNLLRAQESIPSLAGR
jgi:hypothetical protein